MRILIGIIIGIVSMIALISYLGGSGSGTGSTASSTNMDLGTAATSTATTTEEVVASSTDDGAVVPASALSDGQRSALEAAGVDPETFAITPAMVSCAEARLGAERVDEIAAGATPGPMETVQLLGCYSVE